MYSLIFSFSLNASSCNVSRLDGNVPVDMSANAWHQRVCVRNDLGINLKPVAHFGSLALEMVARAKLSFCRGRAALSVLNSCVFLVQISLADDGMKISHLPDSYHIFNAISGTAGGTVVQGISNSSSMVWAPRVTSGGLSLHAFTQDTSHAGWQMSSALPFRKARPTGLWTQKKSRFAHLSSDPENAIEF